MKEYELVQFDWAIKRLLRDKANFDVLEGLLTVVLRNKVKIIEILESEGNKQTSDDKFNRVDIKARNENGEIIIIEVQNTREVDYLLRLMYGVATSVKEHISEGQPYSKIHKVYSISILYFDLGTGDDYVYHGQTVFRGLHTHNELTLTEKERRIMGFMEPREVFPEYYLLMAGDFDRVATTPLEEWMTYLHSGKISPDAKAPGLQEAREKLRVIAMSKEEQNEYSKYRHDVASFLLTQQTEREMAHLEGLEKGRQEGRAEGLEKGRQEGRAEGLEKGRQEGRAKGREEGRAEGEHEAKILIAANLKKQGMSAEMIAAATGLPLTDIAKL